MSGLLVIGILAPQEAGPLGLAQVLLPHFALLTVLLLPVAYFGRSFLLRSALAAVIGLSIVRFAGDWLSLPAGTSEGPRLSVSTWNMEIGSRPPARTIDWLSEHGADVVALQELTPGVAELLQTDPRMRDAYPYMAFDALADVGQGLLSRYPISSITYRDVPTWQEVVLDVDGARITIVNAHPVAAFIELYADLPVGIEPAARNEQLELVKARVDQLLAGGLPTILLGDFNTTPTEPAFDRLASGLTDVHEAVGEGTGWTWRPSRLEFLGLGLLRIDHVLVGPSIHPVSTSTACPPEGDHCLLATTLTIADR